MNILKEIELKDSCSYLDNLEQTTLYKVIEDSSISDYQSLLERGYRRFGKIFSRPDCATCSECKSIKIDVDEYSFSKSERRVLKKASHIDIIIQKPTITLEHLALYDKYHLSMREKKGWAYTKMTDRAYHNSFVIGAYDFGYEILYFDKNRLIGVDLVDSIEDGLSSIYFFYDPEYSHLSLGKFSLLQQIQLAKRSEQKWVYLGYYVKDCPSLSYKALYKPYKTLMNLPSDYDEPIWE